MWSSFVSSKSQPTYSSSQLSYNSDILRGQNGFYSKFVAFKSVRNYNSRFFILPFELFELLRLSSSLNSLIISLGLNKVGLNVKSLILSYSMSSFIKQSLFLSFINYPTLSLLFKSSEEVSLLSLSQFCSFTSDRDMSEF